MDGRSQLEGYQKWLVRSRCGTRGAPDSRPGSNTNPQATLLTLQQTGSLYHIIGPVNRVSGGTGRKLGHLTLRADTAAALDEALFAALKLT